MSRIKSLIIAIFVTMIFAGGCGDDDGGNNNLNNHENPPGWNVNDIVVADNVKVIDESVDVTVESATLTIPASQANKVKDVQAGAIVVSGKGNGFLRRVTSVSEVANSVVLMTESASLAEVIQQGQISGTIPLDFSSNPSQKDGLGLDLSGQVLYDDNGLTITLSQAVINFVPDLNLAIEFDGSSLGHFRVEAVGNLSGSLVAQVVYDGGASFSQTIPLYESAPIITTIWAGFVPIVIVTTLQVEAGFTVNFENSVTLEAGASFGAQVSAGAEYSNGNWNLIADQDFQLTAIGPTLDVTAGMDFRVFLRPKIVSKLYGIAGPTLAIEPYGRLNLSALPSTEWELSAGVLGTIDVEIEAFDHVLANYSDTLFDFEWLLASNAPSCSDADGDGYDGYDTTNCPTGDDQCDTDPFNWTATGCSSCVDLDGDGYGQDCDQGEDCDDGDSSSWNDCVVWVQVSTSGYHTCGVKSDGTTWCWGYNWRGELGDGTTIDSLVPVQVAGIIDVVKVIAFAWTTCALKNDSTVWCWGDNQYGQVGDGSSPYTIPNPVQVVGLSNVTSIGAASQHICAAKSDGTAWCWGGNGYGQIGNGTSGTVGGYDLPEQVFGLTGVVAIDCGSYNSCGLLADGTVWCWGRNDHGQLGDGQSHEICAIYDCSKTPVQVQGINDAVEIVVGGSHSCVRRASGTYWCWGANTHGSIGDNTTITRLTPVEMIVFSNASTIATGVGYTCGILPDGTLWCWGGNDYGQLGDSTNTNSTAAVQVVGASDVVQAELSRFTSCSVNQLGELWCWGRNDYGQLGDGQTHQDCGGYDCSPTPVQVLGP